MDTLIPPDRCTTDRFLIRSYEPGDGAALREATVSSYEHLRRFMAWARAEQSVEEAEAVVRQARGRWLLATDFTLGLFAPGGGEVWGGCGFHLREGPLSERVAEIGMWIRASRAGQGLATDALRALLRWGFTEWPWERLSWRCDSRNLASIRVAEKAGMRREGVLVGNAIAADGVRRDTVCFALSRAEV